MSPLDDHLRATLTSHAADAPTQTDPFTGIERRARHLRRRRVAVGTTGAAAVAGLAIVGGLALTGSFDASDRVVVPVTHGGNGEPTDTASPEPSALPDGRFLDWPYRSGAGTATVDVAGSTHPLWAGDLPDGTLVVIGQVDDADGTVHSHAWVTPAHGADYEVDGVPIDPSSTPEVSFVVTAGIDPKLLVDGRMPYVIVVGAPATGQIAYAANSTDFKPETTTDGVAVFARDTSAHGDSDSIQVLDGNGDLDHPLYVGAIDTESRIPLDLGPTPTSSPQ